MLTKVVIVSLVLLLIDMYLCVRADQKEKR